MWEKFIRWWNIQIYIYGRERTPKSEILLKLYTKFNIDRDNIASSKNKLNSILEHVKEIF